MQDDPLNPAVAGIAAGILFEGIISLLPRIERHRTRLIPDLAAALQQSRDPDFVVLYLLSLGWNGAGSFIGIIDDRIPDAVLRAQTRG